MAGQIPLFSADHAILLEVLIVGTVPAVVEGDAALLSGVTAGQAEQKTGKGAKGQQPFHSLSTSVSKDGKVTVKQVPSPGVLCT